MPSRRLLTSTIVLLPVLAAPAPAATLDEVDPFTGTGVRSGAPDQGNTVPGPQLPFGFANPSPDTDCPKPSGYCHGAPIIGFSQTHVSGTGGDKYGNFRLIPAAGSLSSRAADATARPGYYTVTLVDGGVRAELTAARMATVTRFTYPAGPEQALRLDATSHVAGSQRAARVRVTRTGRRTFSGTTTMAGGWGNGRYTLHFAAELDRVPASARVTRGKGFVARFDTRSDRNVEVRVGLSFTSRTRARANLRREVRASFDGVRARAESAWSRALGRITVDGGTVEQRSTFATALYHAQLMPHNVADTGTRYDDFFTLWDTFRTQNPLVTLLEPSRTARFIDSLVRVYRRSGWMPDALVAGDHGVTQVGSNGDVLVADAMVKGVRGPSYRTAYRALRKNAEVDSRKHWQEGRQVRDYKRRGWVPLGKRASGSRTMEYAYDDFAVSQVARRLGRRRDAARYRRRASNWRKLWDPSVRSVRPRDRRGRFLEPFDPLRRYQDWTDPFYEGSARIYSTWVPQDAQGLISRLGGDAAATGWLDETMRHYDAANEPSLFAPWLYAHAGRHDRAAEWSRRLMADHYGTGPGGLPGNDDAGALSAWYVWNSIGLYPNAGQAFYYVGSPVWTRARIDLPRGRVFTVEAPGSSAVNRYVVGATLNGRPLDRAYLTHAEVARGGTLRLQMAATPNGWGAANRPPSITPR